MANEKVMVDGIRVFNKHQNAPDFVKASIVITPDDLLTFCTANDALMSEYQGKKQLRLQLLESQAGKLYMAVDTYKVEPNPKSSTAYVPKSDPDDPGNLPF